jgi:sialate O-acetylesterase
VSEAWTSADTLGKHADFGPPVTHLSEDAGRLKELIGEYKEGLVAWRQKVEATDAGFAGGKPAWNAVDLDDSAWAEIELPNLWETQGYRGLDGYVWFRREINLPEAWAGKDLELHLTGINDANQAWFGGVQIADFADQPGLETPRRYDVPGRAVRAGTNVIAVRVYDMGNNGGFVRSTGVMELLNQEQKEKAISLSGRWKMRVGVELKDLPGRPQAPIAVGGNPNVPTVLYNSMIAPLIPFAIKGAIWYQGEANAGRAYQYRSLFPALIEDWRAHWGQGDFPFLFVQLENFQERKNQPAGDAWAINPFCNHYKADGLPASPLRTDDWPSLTAGKR